MHLESTRLVRLVGHPASVRRDIGVAFIEPGRQQWPSGLSRLVELDQIQVLERVERADLTEHQTASVTRHRERLLEGLARESGLVSIAVTPFEWAHHRRHAAYRCATLTSMNFGLSSLFNISPLRDTSHVRTGRESMKQQLHAKRGAAIEYFDRSTAALTEEDATFTPTEGTFTAAQQVAHAAQTIDWFVDGAFLPDGFSTWASRPTTARCAPSPRWRTREPGSPGR